MSDDEYADLRAYLAQPAKWQGVDRQGAWVASTENGNRIYVYEWLVRLLAERDALRERVEELQQAVRVLTDNWPRTIPAPMDMPT